MWADIRTSWDLSAPVPMVRECFLLEEVVSGLVAHFALICSIISFKTSTEESLDMLYRSLKHSSAGRRHNGSETTIHVTIPGRAKNNLHAQNFLLQYASSQENASSL
jgi:hypothetical protein